MNKMYEYLEEHAYISKNKKSNYQFELTRERAECIANKYNNLCEEQDKEIERLNNIINELEKWLEEDLKQVYRDAGHRHNLILEVLDKLQELKGSDKE